ncbi:DUF2007 domain-containing protein [Mucilaginibacter daejeonensis]|uniref:putative signal transducing protein n=1 Tax=Mucilaginibacter daejeonensis TaxID=398049 RepID=UPI001D1735AF|nr:DUF2007 domain-containing protein [Mucilaginibacter daejeonensis]UEG53990.1 DUF2007 domain-containing protein [Mucilaginibacter daejeonensis]
MEKNWIKIYTSSNFYQAEIIKQVLTEHAIGAVLLNKQASSHQNFGSIEVYIHEKDLADAIELMVMNQISL